MLYKSKMNWFKPLRTILIVAVVVGFYVQSPFVQSVSADSIYECVSMTAASGVKLKVDADGNQQPADIPVTVSVYGDSAIPANSYRLFYNRYGDSNWPSIELNFQPDPNNPGDKYFVASTSFPATLGDAKYQLSVETKDAVKLKFGPRALAPFKQNEECRYFDIQVGLDFGTKELFAKSCESINAPDDFITCSFQTNGDGSGQWAYQSGSCSGGVSVAKRCSDGGKSDTAGNYNGTFPNPVDTSGNYVCVKCEPSGTVTNNLKHGEACDSASGNLCDTAPLYTNLKNGTRASQLLNCGPAPSGDSVAQRCSWFSNTAQVGTPCLKGGNECIKTDVSDGNIPVYCKVASGAVAGTCETTAAFPCSAVGPNTDCVKALGAGAQCVRTIDGLFCAPEDSVPTTASATSSGPFDNSTDFGIRNCPGAVFKDTGKVDSSGNPIGVVVIQEKGTMTDEQYSALTSDFTNCVACIKIDHGTWTGSLGCVQTSSIDSIFGSILRIGIGIMGGVALLRLIWLGIVTAQSADDNKVAEARRGVLATLGGIAIVVFSVIIVRAIGVNLLNIVPSGFFG